MKYQAQWKANIFYLFSWIYFRAVVYIQVFHNTLNIVVLAKCLYIHNDAPLELNLHNEKSVLLKIMYLKDNKPKLLKIIKLTIKYCAKDFILTK